MDGRCGPLTLQLQGMRAAVREHHDIAGLQGQVRLAGERQPGLTLQYQMVGRDARRDRFLLQDKRRAEVAAHIEGGAHRVQGKQAAEAIHKIDLRRMDKF